MMKRQSAVLLSKVSQNEQLHKAVMEIESLSEKIEDQKSEYQKQVCIICFSVGVYFSILHNS